MQNRAPTLGEKRTKIMFLAKRGSTISDFCNTSKEIRRFFRWSRSWHDKVSIINVVCSQSCIRVVTIRNILFGYGAPLPERSTGKGWSVRLYPPASRLQCSTQGASQSLYEKPLNNFAAENVCYDATVTDSFPVQAKWPMMPPLAADLR